MYLNERLATSAKMGGEQITNDGDLYIGSYTIRKGVPGSGFDNFQIFNKALTAEEITILALANKDVI